MNLHFVILFHNHLHDDETFGCVSPLTCIQSNEKPCRSTQNTCTSSWIRSFLARKTSKPDLHTKVQMTTTNMRPKKAIFQTTTMTLVIIFFFLLFFVMSKDVAVPIAFYPNQRKVEQFVFFSQHKLISWTEKSLDGITNRYPGPMVLASHQSKTFNKKQPEVKGMHQLLAKSSVISQMLHSKANPLTFFLIFRVNNFLKLCLASRHIK